MVRTRLFVFVLASLMTLSGGSAVFALEPGADGTSGPAATSEYVVSDHTLETAPDVTIAFTVFRTSDMTDVSHAPLVLHSHGWGGTRASSVGGTVQDLLDAGYGVLSFDARGHGDSTGLATIHHKDHEIQDIIQLIDWAYDNLEWAQREGLPEDKDLVMGAVGGSYGGGYQLMTASYDDRLDAIVPQMTWNDLRYSLAPNGVVKSTWVDALYGFGLQGVDMHPDIHRWFAEALATNQLPADAREHLRGSSPNPEDITAPTLLVQGLPDALFNFNEAVRNYEAIREAGTEAAIVGYLGGHVLPFPGQPVGTMGPARGGEPCGTYSSLALGWFAKHLRGEDFAVPEGITYALEDGTCAHWAEHEPLAYAVERFDALPAPNAAGTILVPLDAPDGVLAGVPLFSATLVAPSETIFTVGLAIANPERGVWFVDDQTAFLRVTPGLGTVTTEVSLEMTGVAARLGEGDQLFLRIDGLHEWAPTGGGRTPGGGLFTDVAVGLPYLG